MECSIVMFNLNPDPSRWAKILHFERFQIPFSADQSDLRTVSPKPSTPSPFVCARVPDLFRPTRAHAHRCIRAASCKDSISRLPHETRAAWPLPFYVLPLPALLAAI